MTTEEGKRGETRKKKRGDDRERDINTRHIRGEIRKKRREEREKEMNKIGIRG